MKAIVLGGAGGVGSGMIKALIDAKDVEQVTIGDVNEERASRILDEHQSEKLRFQAVDVSKAQNIVPHLQGMDVVANCSWYYYNLEVMQACIEVGVDYLDVGGLYHFTLKQMALHDRVKAAGIVVVPGLGSAPGLTNVSAGYCVKRLDKVDAIYIRAADWSEGETFWQVDYSLRTVLDELFKEAPVFQDGETKMIPPLSSSIKFVFPDPVGDVTLYDTLHSEVATLPTSYKEKGIKEVRYQMYWPPTKIEGAKVLRELGFADEKPLKVNGASISPREFLHLLAASRDEGRPPNLREALAIEARGEQKGRKTSVILRLTKVPQDINLTSLCMAIGTLLIGRGQTEGKGIRPPEIFVDPDLFIKELLARGITFEEELSTVQPIAL